MSNSLVSTQNRVESPFIIVKIGDYTFGHCRKEESGAMESVFRITYPNYVQSLNIVKINGAVNTYSLKLEYGITQFDDPNRLEKVFSSVSSSREITLSYGDWNAPAYVYKEETAIITKVTSNVDFRNASIVYTVACTSTALSLKAGSFSFGAEFAKPSDVIVRLFKNERYGLTRIFSGMRNLGSGIDQFIARDDKEVQLEAKDSVNILDYIGYLVSCMVCQSDSGGTLKESNYYWAVYDDISNTYGGQYFKVRKVTANAQHNISYNTYEIDVGYPSSDYVTGFTVNADDTWSILYNYSKEIQMPEYVYRIDKSGNIVENLSSSLTSSSSYLKTTEADRSWWSQMTLFPVTAKITIKGLLRPALLMTYLKVNTYFFGHKHVSSGLYIITKQEDTIDSSGYRTTLSLTRISGDTSYA